MLSHCIKVVIKPLLTTIDQISKLPCLAKVLELLVNNQLKLFLSVHPVLSTHQSGFRAKHSTASQLQMTISLLLIKRNTVLPSQKLLILMTMLCSYRVLSSYLSYVGFDCNSCNCFERLSVS